MKRIYGKMAILICLTLVFVISQVNANAAENVLVVAMYGGDFQKSLDKALMKDFEKKYNVKVLVESGVSSAQSAKIRAQKKRPQIDVAILDQGDEILLGKEGLLEKLTPNEVPNIGDLYDIARNPKGVSPGFTFDILGLVYNKANIKTPPASSASVEAYSALIYPARKASQSPHQFFLDFCLYRVFCCHQHPHEPPPNQS